MSYSFMQKTWSISGEQSFGEFSLLNPVIKIEGVGIGEKIQVVVSAKENGGVYSHTINLFYEDFSSSDIVEIVDKVMSEAFPGAEIQE